MGTQWQTINDNYKHLDGYRRVAWPPPAQERFVREFTPLPQVLYPTTATYCKTMPEQPGYQQYNQQAQYQQQQQQQQQAQYPDAINLLQHQVQQQYEQQQQGQQTDGPYSSSPHMKPTQPLIADYRDCSPGIVTLRKEAPYNQKPLPVYTSQPATISLKGGSNMRGDLKWPPAQYKEAAARANEERKMLAMGPVCRPRKVHRDYTAFFARNALTHHYPGYKVPPGTQHIIN